MKLNYKDILEYQQNREPYLMIDYVENLIPGKLAEGYKDLKSEWFSKFIGKMIQICQECFK